MFTVHTFGFSQFRALESSAQLEKVLWLLTEISVSMTSISLKLKLYLQFIFRQWFSVSLSSLNTCIFRTYLEIATTVSTNKEFDGVTATHPCKLSWVICSSQNLFKEICSSLCLHTRDNHPVYMTILPVMKRSKSKLLIILSSPGSLNYDSHHLWIHKKVNLELAKTY